MQRDDVALFREKVVLDVEAEHRRKVAMDDRARDERRQLRSFPFALLDAMQRVAPPLLGLRMLGVVVRHLRVEVPAEVIESHGRIVDPLLDRGRVFLEQMLERDDDVGDLDAGVVDVVLDLDLFTLVAQATGQRVAEDGVAEVADVGGLVRVDVRVLDDDLRLLRGRATSRRPCARRRTAP